MTKLNTVPVESKTIAEVRQLGNGWWVFFHFYGRDWGHRMDSEEEARRIAASANETIRMMIMDAVDQALWAAGAKKSFARWAEENEY